MPGTGECWKLDIPPEQFNDLNMLSKIPKHGRSTKNKLKGGAMYYTGPEDLMKRLKLITGIRRAGNNNIQLYNETWEIIDKLRSLGEISKEEYDRYVERFM